MDKKSKILLWAFLILVLLSGAIVFYRYMILKDFEVIEPVVEEVEEEAVDSSSISK